MQKYDANSSIECCVCLEPMNRGDDIFTAGCGHSYHFDCIMPWLRQSSSCPLDRSEINLGDQIEVGKISGLDHEEDSLSLRSHDGF